MRRYVENGFRVVEVDDLSFLYDRGHFSWLAREIRHFRLKRAISKADKILAGSEKTADGLHRYYGLPLDKIEYKQLN